MKKFISLTLAAIMLCTMFAACSKKDSTTLTAKVTITIEAEDTKILDKAEVTIDGVDGEAPLAIDAIIAALDDNEIEYTTVEFAGSDKLEKIGDYDTENNAYIWELYLNGNDDPASGRLASVEIEDGDVLLLKRNAYESVITDGSGEVSDK